MEITPGKNSYKFWVKNDSIEEYISNHGQVRHARG